MLNCARHACRSSLRAPRERAPGSATAVAATSRFLHCLDPAPHEDPRVPRQGNPAQVRRAGAARLSGLHACKRRWRPRRSSAARSGSSRRRSTPAAAARAAASSWRARSTRSRSWPARSSACSSITHQTGPEGQKVRRLLIEEGADIKKEYYVAARDRPRHAEGGADGLQRRRHGHRGSGARHAREDHQGLRRSARRPDRRAGRASWPTASACPPARRRRPSTCSRSSTSCYMETDASLAEINPLILEGNGNIKALDAKFNFDANALFRHPEIVAYRDLDEEDPAEDRSQQVRPGLHQPRRQHRLPGQRRRPGDGDDGHHQAVRRRAGQLPRRRRRRHRREGDRSLQDHAEATRT